MLSEGAGFNEGTLEIRVNGPDGLTIAHGYMDGSKFHNGQIVGQLETAPRETPGASVEALLKSRQFDGAAALAIFRLGSAAGRSGACPVADSPS